MIAAALLILAHFIPDWWKWWWNWW